MTHVYRPFFRSKPNKGNRDQRTLVAFLVGLVFLGLLLPCTGHVSYGLPVNPKMWRCGSFQFYPDTFFPVVGAVTVSTGCTLYGIARHKTCENIGWCLFTLMFLTIAYFALVCTVLTTLTFLALLCQFVMR